MLFMRYLLFLQIHCIQIFPVRHDLMRQNMPRIYLAHFVSFVLLGTLVPETSAFRPRHVYSHPPLIKQAPRLLATASEDLTEPEQRVYSLVEQLHKSQYSFRIVVVGNGAILETTSILGPVMKLNTSPKTGNALLTLASHDQSFEFHIQTAQVSKVALTEKEANDTVMRVIRFLNNVGAPLCSLILRDDSEEAIAWYAELRSTYGEDLQL